jgi:hypothetical protein
VTATTLSTPTFYSGKTNIPVVGTDANGQLISSTLDVVTNNRANAVALLSTLGIGGVATGTNGFVAGWAGQFTGNGAGLTNVSGTGGTGIATNGGTGINNVFSNASFVGGTGAGLWNNQVDAANIVSNTINTARMPTLLSAYPQALTNGESIAVSFSNNVYLSGNGSTILQFLKTNVYDMSTNTFVGAYRVFQATNMVFSNSVAYFQLTNGAIFITNFTAASQRIIIDPSTGISIMGSNPSYFTNNLFELANNTVAGSNYVAGTSYVAGNVTNAANVTTAGSNWVGGPLTVVGNHTNQANMSTAGSNWVGGIQVVVGTSTNQGAAYDWSTRYIGGNVFTTNSVNVGTTLNVGGQQFGSNTLYVTAGGETITGILTNNGPKIYNTNALTWSTLQATNEFTFQAFSTNVTIAGWQNIDQSHMYHGWAAFSNGAASLITVTWPAGTRLLGGFTTNQPLNTCTVTNSKVAIAEWWLWSHLGQTLTNVEWKTQQN